MAIEQFPQQVTQLPTVAGQVRAGVANAIVGVYSECYGKGPTRAKAYLVEDLCVCVLNDVFTRVERTLIDAGEDDVVRSMRLKFQTAMRDEIMRAVEQALGREVKSYMSELDLKGDTAAEVFVLAPEAEPAA